MKNLKNLGQALSKAEQKEVNGGKKLWWCAYEFCPNAACGLPKNWCQNQA